MISGKVCNTAVGLSCVTRSLIFMTGNRAMYQGGLEISVDASEEVLTLLVHYIHTGLLPSLSASYPPLLTHIISTSATLL
jgi:hypothetical protein